MGNRNNSNYIINCFIFRWTSWGVESALTDEGASTKFKQRANFDYIVLFDEDSYEIDLKSDHCLKGLKQAIFSVRERMCSIFINKNKYFI